MHFARLANTLLKDEENPPHLKETQAVRRALSTNLKPGGAHAISCGLDASSCHVSTRAARLSFMSVIHCWTAADFSPTERYDTIRYEMLF